MDQREDPLEKPAEVPPSAAYLSPKVAGGLFAGLILGGLGLSGWLLTLLSYYEDWRYLFVGYIYGSSYSQAIMAAVLLTIGPCSFYRRLIGSMIWLGLIAGSWLLPSITNSDGGEYGVIIASTLLLWIIAQIPLWAMAWFLRFKMQLARSNKKSNSNMPADFQFGIRHMLQFTAGVAIILGAGRAFLLSVGTQWLEDREWTFYLFLILAALIIALPVVLAMFLSRRAIPATLIALLFAGLVTGLEYPLFQQLGLLGPDFWHFVWINFFTIAWAMTICGIVRLAGYSFGETRADKLPEIRPSSLSG